MARQYWQGSNIPLVQINGAEGMVPDFCGQCGEPCIVTSEAHTHTDNHQCLNGHTWELRYENGQMLRVEYREL